MAHIIPFSFLEYPRSKNQLEVSDAQAPNCFFKVRWPEQRMQRIVLE